jgi:hypothetical protein
MPLEKARARPRQALPESGSSVEVRGRRWLVEEIKDGEEPASIVSLSCIDDDAQGDELRAIWEAEVDARLLDDDPWSYLALTTLRCSRRSFAPLNGALPLQPTATCSRPRSAQASASMPISWRR